MLTIHHWEADVRDVLGPGLRAVVWVQGCTLHCPGCMVPETWRKDGGRQVSPLALAEELLAQPGLDGVTVSGGEPTEQAGPVAVLLAAMKAVGKNTWVYSGYTLEELVAKNDPAIDGLLTSIDVLVDGRYVQEKAGAFRLRGSSNQRIIHLTSAIPRLDANENENATTEHGDTITAEFSQVQLRLSAEGQLIVVGVPPPGFLQELRARLEARGVTVTPEYLWK